MPTKLMSLRYPGVCRSCSIGLSRGSRAVYDSDAKNVCCTDCFEGTSSPSASAPPAPRPLPPPAPIAQGIAGSGPQQEYARRAAKREAAIEQKWGRLAGVAKVFSEEPQSTIAWRKGAEGERRLAAFLDRTLGESVVVLHSRRLPRTRGDIDHLLVAPSGVWVVDSKNYSGRVEVRDVGNWRTIDRRLYVNNRDKTKLVDGFEWQVAAVRAVLDPMGFGEVPMHPTLLFTESDWGWFAKPIEIKGVRAMWGMKLCELVTQPGPLSAAAVTAIATQLSAALPPIATGAQR